MRSPLKGYESNERHTNRIIRCVAWSADEKYVATGDGTEKVIIWDTDPQQVDYGQEFQTSVVVDVLRNSGHTSVVRSIDWAPEGHDLVSGDSYGRIFAWRVDVERGASRTPFKQLWGASGLVNDLLWLKEDRIAAITSDGFLFLWDPNDRGRTVQPIFERLLAASGHCMAASADLSRIAIGKADGTLEIVDAADGSRLDQFNCYDGVICTVAWCNDHEIAFAAEGDSLLVIDVRSGVITDLLGHRAPILSIATTPDGRFAISQSLDMSLRLWDLTIKAPLEMLAFQCGRHPNQRIGFADNGTDLITLGRRDHVFRTWRLDIEQMRDGLRNVAPSRLSQYTRMDRLAVFVGEGVSADQVIASMDDVCERLGLKCVGMMSEGQEKAAEVLVDVRSSGTELLGPDMICRPFLADRPTGVVYHYLLQEKDLGESSCRSCGNTVASDQA